MNKPTTPSIAELLYRYDETIMDAVRKAAYLGLPPGERINEARARLLAHVAAIEAQRDEALRFIEKAFLAYPNLDLDIANVTASDSPDSLPAR